jgi:hypothetical protein
MGIRAPGETIRAPSLSVMPRVSYPADVKVEEDVEERMKRTLCRGTRAFAGHLAFSPRARVCISTCSYCVVLVYGRYVACVCSGSSVEYIG